MIDTSMLNLQADLIDGERRVLDVAVWACESHDMPETARSIRLTMDILRESALWMRTQAHLEDQ